MAHSLHVLFGYCLINLLSYIKLVCYNVESNSLSNQSFSKPVKY